MYWCTGFCEECLNNTVEPDKKLEQKCKHCSERERSAMEAERAANKYKQVEYMQEFLGEEFEGVISGVASFGFWVETVEHKCEGLVSMNSLLEYDDFRLWKAITAWPECVAGVNSEWEIRCALKW